jgi:hypothetical protein
MSKREEVRRKVEALIEEHFSGPAREYADVLGYLIPVSEDGSADEIMDALDAALPDGWTADWTGSGDTDAEGNKTSDFVTIYRVELCPDGCDVSFVGDYDSLAKARAAAESGACGLPRADWDTARAAGHVGGMTAPEGGPEEYAEADEWVGYYAITAFR